MSIPLASVSELEARLGRPLADAGERDRATALLNAASALVRSVGGQSWDNGEVPAGLEMVALQAAWRAFINPRAAISEATGPFSVTREAGAAQGVYLTAQEERLVETIAASTTGKAGTYSLRLGGLYGADDRPTPAITPVYYSYGQIGKPYVGGF